MRQLPTILCVDDYPSLLQTLALALEGLGFRVLTAATMEEALQQGRNGPDLVLLDDRMCPGCDTSEACAAVHFRAANPQVKVVVWSADDRALRHTPPCAAIGLLKPVDPAQLAQSLRELLSTSPGSPASVDDDSEAAP